MSAQLLLAAGVPAATVIDMDVAETNRPLSSAFRATAAAFFAQYSRPTAAISSRVKEFWASHKISNYDYVIGVHASNRLC